MSVFKLDNGKIEPLAKITGAAIMEQAQKNVEEAVMVKLEEDAPKTPLEAAIDRATGFKPEDMSNVARETKREDSETKQGDSETKRGDSETKKRDWVEEAYKCFIKDAGDIDPTDPISAIAHYFAKNATPELKARCEKEGKNATGCWKFIEAVARKALHGSSGHIDPGVVYAIAMHWFEDVPKDWNAASAKAPARQAKPKPAKTAKPKKPAERPRTPSVIKKEAAKAKAAKASASAAKPLRRDKKRPKQSQGFFFGLLETPAATPEKESEVQG